MSAIGRNEPCRCRSGKKTKRCCGIRRGPSDGEMAKAFLATHGRLAARRLVRLSTAQLHELFDDIVELPAGHLSLQLPLPRLSSPDLEALRWAVDHNDPDAADQHAGTVLARIDTPEQRARLAAVVLDLADSGVIDGDLADTAIVDLDSRSSALMRASLLHAMSVSVGASRTPSGLLVVSR
jgi:hypothetical protein